MRLSTSFSGPAGKGLTALILAKAALCIFCFWGFSVLPGWAIWGWGGKQPSAVQPIPPTSRISPAIEAPPANEPGGRSGASPPAARPEASPSSQALVPSTQSISVEDPLQVLSEKRIFSETLLGQTTPVTRAQLAEVLVKALGHQIDRVSEFPFYRDVSADSPAYPFIEVARAKKLLDYPADHGFYHPEQPVSFEVLYLALSHAITGAAPPPQRTEYLLRDMPGHQSFSPALRDALAKMAQSRFFTRTRRYQTVFTPPQAFVTPQELAPLVHYLMFLNQRRAPLLGIPQVLPQLPAGLTLQISPATGILEERLKAGGRIRFQVLNTVGSVPRTSTLFGSVTAVLPDRSYRIQFDNLRTPEGQVYETRAYLSVSFSARDKLGFIVPGETFEITTLPVSPSSASVGTSSQPQTTGPSAGPGKGIQAPPAGESASP